MTIEDNTNELFYILWSNTFQTLKRKPIIEKILNYINLGVNPNLYSEKYKTTLLFMALEKHCSPEIIKELIKNGFDKNQKTLYYDTIYDRDSDKDICIERYRTIENIILISYHIATNDNSIDRKAIKKYKFIEQKVGDTESTPDKLDEKELKRWEKNMKIADSINTLINQYCTIFGINLDKLIERGEELPDAK